MKKITIGILAHVDAGKTTLSEAILYTCGAVKKLGRVDRRDSFLDNEDEERKRGITIFSKQARAVYNDVQLTLIDTPGHMDFSGEMERSLQILDYAVLVISGTDGAQAHTSTLISLLREYEIPTFIFVTKMDVSKFEREELKENLRQSVGDSVVDITDSIDYESFALCDDVALEKYLECGEILDTDISYLIQNRKVFPCIFGSGLKLDAVDRLLECLEKYALEKEYSSQLSGRVYKIARDNQGKRLTFIKLTGGKLSVRDMIGDEKISQIRLYSGIKFEQTESVCAGDVCAVLGLNKTHLGQRIGAEENEYKVQLVPVLTYKVLLPKGVDAIAVYPYFKELEEEDPLLNVVWNEKYDEIEIQLMGKVQTEILKSIIAERFSLDVSFGSGRIIYKETIEDIVEGIGHYEPLKHYSEVHLLMEPLPRGSGIELASSVPTDELELNWQRLILTHLEEKQHLGVLTGSPITDVRITLIAGRAHLKHTEGGDFRESTYRAVRQGLMKAKSVLLEPMYDFVLEVPNECVGRAMNDIHNNLGTHDAPETGNVNTVIRGTAPVSTMSEYQSEVLSYTNGKGRLSLKFSGYSECHDSKTVIEQKAYEPTSDIKNSPDSIFCSHGAGVNITWDQVDTYCHIPPLKKMKGDEVKTIASPVFSSSRGDVDEQELEAIMMREFGPIRRKSYSDSVVIAAKPSLQKIKKTRIIVDGYNVIFSWDDLKELAKDNIDLARERLVNMLVNYRAYTGSELILVFDAYLVDNTVNNKYDEDKLHIVYTDKGESADAYIEKLVDEIGKNENVKVVTSDAMIQLTAVKSGVMRISSREFRYDIDLALEQMRKQIN